MFGDDFQEIYEKSPILAIDRVILQALKNANSNDFGRDKCAESAAVIRFILQNTKFRFISERDMDYFQCTNKQAFTQLFSAFHEKFIKEKNQYHLDQISANYPFISKDAIFEFSDEQLSDLQVKINDLRDFIRESGGLTEDHKRRLLVKLERLQSELHKKMSDLDRFYGLVGDASIVLGKLGRDAKPFVDRIREIVAIVTGVQAIAEELPSGFPKISLPEYEDKEEC
ncbi:hypothetical protein [Seleniivibrio woodruffii]|uniref:hypothetical protein n=1 Tax=Seleniivibrio woodruffii TaxID=1078050 RepID=UPI0026F123C3|nr:hypothetical protein [Seleniivibrio woodruffii]